MEEPQELPQPGGDKAVLGHPGVIFAILGVLGEEVRFLGSRAPVIDRADAAEAEGVADHLKRQLHDPEITSDAHRLVEIYAEHQEAQKKIEQLYQRWEELESSGVGPGDERTG